MRLSSYVYRTFIFPISMSVRSAWFKNNVGCLHPHKGATSSRKGDKGNCWLKNKQTSLSLLAKLGSLL